jgi:hypothetical protein
VLEKQFLIKHLKDFDESRFITTDFVKTLKRKVMRTLMLLTMKKPTELTKSGEHPKETNASQDQKIRVVTDVKEKGISTCSKCLKKVKEGREFCRFCKRYEGKPAATTSSPSWSSRYKKRKLANEESRHKKQKQENSKQENNEPHSPVSIKRLDILSQVCKIQYNLMT